MKVERIPPKEIPKTAKELLKEKYKGQPITPVIRNELVDQMLKDYGYLE